MKKLFAFLVGASLSMGATAQSALTFDANAGVKSSMTAYDGTNVNYTAYERLFYVTNVEDSTYQFLNVYGRKERHSRHRFSSVPTSAATWLLLQHSHRLATLRAGR